MTQSVGYQPLPVMDFLRRVDMDWDAFNRVQKTGRLYEKTKKKFDEFFRKVTGDKKWETPMKE